MVHKLAVIKLIRELELEETTMRNMTSIKETIISLGIEHGNFMSRIVQTSLI
jgi:hypothetical protein